MRELPTGTVTFLFSDIEGSTRLLDELGDQYAELLAEHHLRMRAAFAAKGGVEVDTAGDAFFVAFERPGDALGAAVAAQEALAEIGLRVRMGIHSGQPLVTETGYVGMDIHRAARIMSAGHGGQVLVSDETRALVGDEPRLTDLGLHRLKDLTEPQRLWQFGEREFPPLKTLYQTNLPVQPTPLVGRESELAQVLELLERSRLVTLTGAGGSGKTRLALQAAAELVDEYKDGVWWVSLGALRGPELVEPTIAQVIGAKDGLADHLRGKEALLLLDNFEQLLDAAPRIADVLREAPDMRVLVTSRERLAIAAEHEYAVPTMVSVEAVALFTTRARQLQPSFEPDEAVEEICRRLDGLPLAIELAAALVKVLHPEQMLERLAHSLDLLTTGTRDAPERQQTLRATIDWSYDLLDEDEKELFARLAVFAGSFDLEAAEAICGADLETLAALVDKSLLRRTDQARFFMLETILEYAFDRLEESPREAKELQRRHAAFFAALAADAKDKSGGRHTPESLREVEEEQANVRAALSWLLEKGDAEVALRAVAGMWRFWIIRGELDEGQRWTEAVLARASAEPSLERAWVVAGLGEFYRARGDLEPAIRAKEEARTLAGSISERPIEAAALHDLGEIREQLGDLAGSLRLHRQSLALRREIGDPIGVAHALSGVGSVALSEGRLLDARRVFEEILEIGAREGSLEFRVYALLNLGETARREGEIVDAKEMFSQALALLSETIDVDMLVRGVEGLGAVAVDEGSMERAARLFGAAETIRRSRGYGPDYETRPEYGVLRQRHDLHDGSLAAAWAEGRGMTVERALEYALAP